MMLSLLVLAAQLSGPARVLDGDTLVINHQHIRLFGIDAPEKKQWCGQKPCGQIATAALAWRINGKVVSCSDMGTEKWGRTLAVCYIGTEDLNKWMVRQGYAVAYRHYSMRYADSENLARAEKRGIWSGRFQWPRDWRRSRR